MKAKSRLHKKRRRNVKGQFSSRMSWGERLLILNLLLLSLVGSYIAYSKRDVPSECSEPLVEVREVRADETPTKERDFGVDTWTGTASYYSREGCIGCSANLHMANGEPLDDTKLTIAFNKLPLGKKVRIINNDTHDSVLVEITDTGGFERLGRIADMTIATKNAIGCKDLCDVTILYDN